MYGGGATWTGRRGGRHWGEGRGFERREEWGGGAKGAGCMEVKGEWGGEPKGVGVCGGERGGEVHENGREWGPGSPSVNRTQPTSTRHFPSAELSPHRLHNFPSPVSSPPLLPVLPPPACPPPSLPLSLALISGSSPTPSVPSTSPRKPRFDRPLSSLRLKIGVSLPPADGESPAGAPGLRDEEKQTREKTKVKIQAEM